MLPTRRAPGRDSICGEMLKPIRKPLATILSYLFATTYQWSYTPADWRHGNVCSIYKKGPVTEASSFRPISLTSTFRKLFEMCLAPLVLDVSPQLDVAQCVSQELSLHTGLLQKSTLSPHLFSIFINSLPALLRQAASATTTRVISTSPSCAPSPLWSAPPTNAASNIAINALLLYADDVAILGSAREVQHMLSFAEKHLLALGYRSAFAKCALVILYLY